MLLVFFTHAPMAISTQAKDSGESYYAANTSIATQTRETACDLCETEDNACVSEVCTESVSSETDVSSNTQENVQVSSQEPVSSKTESKPAETVKTKAVETAVKKGKPVKQLQTPSGTEAAAVNEVNYTLSDEERRMVEGILVNEISGGTYNDMLAVAQCILDRAVYYHMSVTDVIYQKNQFSEPSTNTPNKKIVRAVEDVFVNGARVTQEKILFFCASGYAKPGGFHESQRLLFATKYQRYYGKWK